MLLRRLVLIIALLSLPSFAVGCAELPKSPEAQAEMLEANDPLEPVNRVVFDVNDFLDRLLIRPLAELYRFVVPDFMRERVANILSNMGEPVVLVNNLLQGEVSRAGITVQRFVVNTTAGLGGMFEVAEELDLPKQIGDFGQTLFVWGAGSGPYIVLPAFGPSTLRDGVGRVVDMVMSPWQYLVARGDTTTEDTFLITYLAANGLTKREENLEAYDAMRTGSLDFYSEMRSVYRQHRDRQLGVELPDMSRLFDFAE